MWRSSAVSLLLVLALAPAASGQEPEYQLPTPEYELPAPTATPAPGAGVAPSTGRDCERPVGTDGDYAYDPDCCRPERDGDTNYTDDDYVYACPSEGAPTSGAASPPPPPAPPKSVVRPIAGQQLPLTGGEPLIIALMGSGFLLCGAGLRLRRGATPRP